VTAREWVDQWSDDNVMGDDSNGLVVMDGYDDCIIGIGSRFGCEPFIVYDIKKVLAKLQADGMTYEEAVEFHEFNQAGAWVGPHTPAFIEMPED